jgi:capsular polysaccharide export protein
MKKRFLRYLRYGCIYLKLISHLIVIRLTRRIEEVYLLYGFNDWKRLWIDEIFNRKIVLYAGYNSNPPLWLLKFSYYIGVRNFALWSYKIGEQKIEYLRSFAKAFYLFEDGFLRSTGLGIEKTRPLTLCLDSSAMHFDRLRYSDLDKILNSISNDHYSKYSSCAEDLINQIKRGVTKYNLVKTNSIFVNENALMAENSEIVIGQVSNDLSLIYASSRYNSTSELAIDLANKNPETNYCYRIHPQELINFKFNHYIPRNLKILYGNSFLQDVAPFKKVHTICSLSGFEAALLGKEVHTYGMPFYAGWGFTTDHEMSFLKTKRTKTLSLKEVLIGAYFIYQKISNKNPEKVDFDLLELVINNVSEKKI